MTTAQVKLRRPNPFDTFAVEERKAQIEFLISEILEWYMNTDADFDPTYVESLEEQFISRGDLTDKQIESLQNIFNTWLSH